MIPSGSGFMKENQIKSHCVHYLQNIYLDHLCLLVIFAQDISFQFGQKTRHDKSILTKNENVQVKPLVK
jgi:hypothetical protein